MSGIFDDTVEYGPGGYDTTKPNNNVIATRQRQLPQREANERDVYSKARAALALNATYLSLASPTAAQNTAQIKRLTREVNALIRLLLAELQDVSDT